MTSGSVSQPRLHQPGSAWDLAEAGPDVVVVGPFLPVDDMVRVVDYVDTLPLPRR